MKRAVEWMAKNGVAANLLMIFIIVAGVLSLLNIRQEVFPEFSLDTIQVRVEYPGASPDEVEEAIAKFEEAIALDPELELEPETEAKQLAAPGLVEQGRDLAKCAGASRVTLMRGHGCAVAAPTLKLAVTASIYLQVNAQLQMDAMRLGQVTYLSAGEIQKMTATQGGALMGSRAWEYWAARAEEGTK